MALIATSCRINMYSFLSVIVGPYIQCKLKINSYEYIKFYVVFSKSATGISHNDSRMDTITFLWDDLKILISTSVAC